MKLDLDRYFGTKPATPDDLLRLADTLACDDRTGRGDLFDANATLVDALRWTARNLARALRMLTVMQERETALVLAEREAKTVGAVEAQALVQHAKWFEFSGFVALEVVPAPVAPVPVWRVRDPRGSDIGRGEDMTREEAIAKARELAATSPEASR
jgi:hypothetical protein